MPVDVEQLEAEVKSLRKKLKAGRRKIAENNKKMKEKENKNVYKLKYLKLVEQNEERNKRNKELAKILNEDRTKIIDWQSIQKIKSVKVKDIYLAEECHLNQEKKIYFGNLSEAKINPIVVRKIEKKYVLVMGFRTYVLAKILNIDKLDVIITEMTHQEIIDKLGLRY